MVQFMWLPLIRSPRISRLTHEFAGVDNDLVIGGRICDEDICGLHRLPGENRKQVWYGISRLANAGKWLLCGGEEQLFCKVNAAVGNYQVRPG